MSEYKGYDDTDKNTDTKENWIMTYTGQRLSLTNPSPEDIHTDDIMTVLSRTCRCGGHSKFFYSVLDHQFLCWKLACENGESARNQLLILIHDFPEYAIVDVPTPLKRLLKEQYIPIESKMEKAIYDHFNIPYATTDEHKAIKYYDTLAFKCESKVLFVDDSWINGKDEVLPDVNVENVDVDTFRAILHSLLKMNNIKYKGDVL